MGLLGYATSQIPDMANVQKGEYRLACAEAEDKVAQTGRDMVAMKFNIADYPSTFPVYHNVSLPKEGDPQKTIDALLGNVKQLKLAFGYGPDDDFDSGDLIGRDDIWAVLDERETKNGPRNEILYFIISQADVAKTESADLPPEGEETNPATEEQTPKT